MENESLYQHDIEQPLKTILCRQIVIDSNKRSNKRGKLLLYRISGHNIELTISGSRGPNEVVVLPYPFSFVHNSVDKKLVLSYDIRKLFSSQLLAAVNVLLHGIKCSKHINGIITIKYV